MAETRQRALTSLLEHEWITQEQQFYAQLCLEEALVNAVTHGNGGDASRNVSVEMIEDGEVCVIQVRDEGLGFRPETVTLPEAGQHDGRGICLIRHCMEDVSFDRAEGCLIMRMRRKQLCGGGE
jgi:anti-sigma regulatory factor (Ser/Thr protein kinase)